MGITFAVRRALSKPFGLPLGIERKRFLPALGKAAAVRARLALGLYGPLTQLASIHKSDKGVTVWPFHGYTVHYERLFEKRRYDSINILEIGLLRLRDRKQGGTTTCPSLSMWLDYFPRASLYGLDIDDFSMVDLPRTQIFQGNQGTPKDLLTVVEAASNFDIIIDDGSHASYHQQTSLRTLFPFLSSGGVYIVEDLDEQPDDLEESLPRVRRTVDILKDVGSLGEIVTGVRDVKLFSASIFTPQKDGLGIIIKE